LRDGNELVDVLTGCDYQWGVVGSGHVRYRLCLDRETRVGVSAVPEKEEEKTD